MGIVLEGQQKIVKDEIKKFVKNPHKSYLYYSGKAGTGKTTVIQCAIDEMGVNPRNYIATAYTGKAVMVLLQHGLRAVTLHSLIYNLVMKKVHEDYVDSDGEVRTKSKLKMQFVLKDKLPDDIQFIILDEMGMVSDDLMADLLSFGIPVVMMGDHNQLPPVIGKSSLMNKPDFVLTKIMRQAENDPIVYLANLVLDDYPIPLGDYGLSHVIDNYEINERLFRDFDVVICNKNKERDEMNRIIRCDLLNRPEFKPVIGDKMICRQNNYDCELDGFFLTNGMSGFVTDVDYSGLYKNTITIGFQPDFLTDREFEFLDIDYKYLISNHLERKDYGITSKNKFEWGYALTTHLTQGSEYPRVFYMDSFFQTRELTKRIRYTAITRARTAITIVKAPEKKFFYGGNPQEFYSTERSAVRWY